MGIALIWVGYVVYLAGVVWLIYLAWSDNQPLMAVGIFCLAPVFGLVYLISHWDEARIPYGLVILGIVLRVIGQFLGSD